MGKARSYFYKDNDGNMQKYVYCDMCPTDKSKPFTIDQEYNPLSGEGLFITSGKHVALCIPCAKQMGLLKSHEEERVHTSYVGPREEKKEKAVRVTFSDKGKKK
jgi:hypothetical protein